MDILYSYVAHLLKMGLKNILWTHFIDKGPPVKSDRNRGSKHFPTIFYLFQGQIGQKDIFQNSEFGLKLSALFLNSWKNKNMNMKSFLLFCWIHVSNYSQNPWKDDLGWLSALFCYLLYGMVWSVWGEHHFWIWLRMLPLGFKPPPYTPGYPLPKACIW